MRRFWYFDVSVWSDEKKLCLLELCQNGVLAQYCRTENPDTPQKHPSTSDFHEYHSDTPRLPSDIPQTSGRHTPDISREYDMQTDDNRGQLTPPDILKQRCQCPGVSGGVCSRLLACCVPWRCLGCVCGMSGGCLGVYEWHSWKSEALGCVWGVSAFSVLTLKP